MFRTRLGALALAAIFLGSHASAQGPGTVLSYKKISRTSGGGPPAIRQTNQYGRGSAIVGDVDGDGIADLAVGAMGDDDGGTTKSDDYGALYVHFLKADGTVRAWNKISNTRGNFTGVLDKYDEFGRVVCDIGDFDQDGIPDVAVGSVYDDDGGTDRGAVYLIFLTAQGTVKSYKKISNTQGGFTARLDNDDQFGRAIARLGDLDGDGVTELAVGSVRDDDGGSNRGAFFVLFMKSDGTVKSYAKVSDTTGNLTSPLVDYGEFGFDICVLGDRNADGIVDIAVGSPDQKTNGSQIGAVFVCYMNANGTVKQDFRITEGNSGFTGDLDYNDEFGCCVDAFGDVDGDGVVDMAVGAGKDDDGYGGAAIDRGAVWILFLNADATVKAHQKISTTVGGLNANINNNDRFGTSLCARGDVDGNGVPDVYTGARFDDDGGVNAGAMYLLQLRGSTAALGVDRGGVSVADPREQGTVDRFGFEINPYESLDLAAGKPQLGATLFFGLTHPVQGQGEGAQAFLFLATRPAPSFPRGSILAGGGLSARGADGELLLDLGSLVLVKSAEAADAWGAPAIARVEVPMDSSLVGLEIYAQGCWIDGRATPGRRVGLTDGLNVRLGR